MSGTVPVGGRGHRARREAWRAEAEALAPVFIVGDARSGTSIVYRSLQSHPRFRPAAGVDLAESHALEGLQSLLGPGDVTPGPMADFLLGVEGLRAVADDVRPLAARRRLVRRFAGGRRSHPWVWRAAGEHHVVRRYFLEALRRRGAARLVEKTPQHLPFVPHLRAAFPRARIVFMLRHPVDVLSSYRRRFAVDPVASSWADVDADAFCGRWDAGARAALALQHADPGFLLLRYEDFTGDTGATVRRLLEHTGEPYDDACLLRDDSGRRPWRADPHLYAPIRERTKRWDEYLDEATAARVQARLAEPMRMAGYAPRPHPAASAGAATR